MHNLDAGTRVRLTQQVGRRAGTWSATVEGVVVSVEQTQTGSWFAHSKGAQLWLDRLLLRKDDGELTYHNLDQFSHIEVLEAAG